MTEEHGDALRGLLEMEAIGLYRGLIMDDLRGLA